MYRSEVKLRTNIAGEPPSSIRPLSKAKYVRYIPFVYGLFLTTSFFILGMTKSPRPSTLERILGDACAASHGQFVSLSARPWSWTRVRAEACGGGEG